MSDQRFATQPATQPHVAIVGGGMVGVTLAIMLDQAFDTNVKLSLIEKFPLPFTNHSAKDSEQKAQQKPLQQPLLQPILQPSFDARSTALSASSVDILNQLGLWAELKPQAHAINDIHISDQGHYGSTLLHAHDYDVDALGYVIENSVLGHGLMARLQQTSVACIAPATVSHCQMKKQGAVLTLDAEKTRKTITADVVIIADGVDSPLRQSLGIDSEKTPYQQSAIIANVALNCPHNGIAYERFTEQGPLALLPLNDFDGQPRASVVWTRDTDNVDEVMALNDQDFIAQLQQCFGYRADHIAHVGQRHCYPLTLVQAKEQVRSNIVVLGNAAHFLHPVAGQGFNLSLRDSEVLVDVLAQAVKQQQAIGHYSVLQQYEQRREKDQQLTIGLTHMLVNLFSSKKLSLSVVRQLGLLSLHAVPSMKKTLAKKMMGVL